MRLRFLVCAVAVRLHARFQNRYQVKRPVLENLLARLDPGEGEEVENQLVESFDLFFDTLQEAGIDRLVVEGPVEQSLGVGFDRRQGRLELVRRVGHEVLPHALEPA